MLHTNCSVKFSCVQLAINVYWSVFFFAAMPTYISCAYVTGVIFKDVQNA